ncbi:squidulin-like [Lineus longissimus]|uniref:squidulin-like n=1 Tax=Lineus longissimus TaxID=88925 RepID=UPI002B4D1146
MSYFDPNTPDIVLKSLFMKYDTDGSGGLGADELKVLLKDDFGLTEDQAKTYALVLDKDGNKNVTFDEFAAWLRSGERFQTIHDKTRYFYLKKAVELFNKFDADGSHTLDHEEFRQVLASTEAKSVNVEEALKALDSDGNGRISFPEFLKWLNWVPAATFE